MKRNNQEGSAEDLKVIGVTGGIGSGKSTVSKILAGIGAKVVDADKIARDVVRKGEKALEEIVESFGEAVLDECGELNRKHLAEIVFKDKEKLEELNAITHKYIIQKIFEKVERERKDDSAKVFVIDTPIPFKQGFFDLVDEVWVVTANKETRLKRVMERSGLSREEAVDRMNSQLSSDEYLKLADRTIENNNDIKGLEEIVQKLFFQIKNGDAVE